MPLTPRQASYFTLNMDEWCGYLTPTEIDELVRVTKLPHLTIYDASEIVGLTLDMSKDEREGRDESDKRWDTMTLRKILKKYETTKNL